MFFTIYYISYIYIYISSYTWNLFVLYFGASTLQKKAFSNQNKGHLSSKYMYIYIYIYTLYMNLPRTWKQSTAQFTKSNQLGPGRWRCYPRSAMFLLCLDMPLNCVDFLVELIMKTSKYTNQYTKPNLFL